MAAEGAAKAPVVAEAHEVDTFRTWFIFATLTLFFSLPKKKSPKFHTYALLCREAWVGKSSLVSTTSNSFRAKTQAIRDSRLSNKITAIANML